MNKAERKERPILFTGEMVRAIIESRKTVTRRVITPQPHPDTQFVDLEMDSTSGVYWAWDGQGMPLAPVGKCPYGQPGDLLWVRESIYQGVNGYTTANGDWKSTWIKSKRLIKYSATDEPVDTGWTNEPRRHCLVKRPSIHMPRWASRITLRVTDVRAERVQDITQEDVVAEGVRLDPGPRSAGWRDEFATLWDKINKKRGYSWKSNPWTWRIEFRMFNWEEEPGSEDGLTEDDFELVTEFQDDLWPDPEKERDQDATNNHQV